MVTYRCHLFLSQKSSRSGLEEKLALHCLKDPRGRGRKKALQHLWVCYVMSCHIWPMANKIRFSSYVKYIKSGFTSVTPYCFYGQTVFEPSSNLALCIPCYIGSTQNLEIVIFWIMPPRISSIFAGCGIDLGRLVQRRTFPKHYHKLGFPIANLYSMEERIRTCE